MKKIISCLFLALLASVVFVGCKEKTETPPVETPPTNAPAAP